VTERLPSLAEVGKDLLHVPRFAVYLSVTFPFLLTLGFFVFAHLGWWFMALALRSGHAYRVSHFHHHAHFPAQDDLEGAAAKMSFIRALADGVTLQPRIWLEAARAGKMDRSWIRAEGMLIVSLITLSLVACLWTWLPAMYGGLVIMGSWIYPLMTSWIPHDAGGKSEVAQTRLFRGQLVRWLTFEHLYHLEHHLYPQIPHHRWPELARRLDPYFVRMGLVATKLWF
jgi:beta-carotene hydroxylase